MRVLKTIRRPRGRCCHAVTASTDILRGLLQCTRSSPIAVISPVSTSRNCSSLSPAGVKFSPVIVKIASLWVSDVLSTQYGGRGSTVRMTARPTVWLFGSASDMPGENDDAAYSAAASMRDRLAVMRSNSRAAFARPAGASHWMRAACQCQWRAGRRALPRWGLFVR